MPHCLCPFPPGPQRALSGQTPWQLDTVAWETKFWPMKREQQRWRCSQSQPGSLHTRAPLPVCNPLHPHISRMESILMARTRAEHRTKRGPGG